MITLKMKKCFFIILFLLQGIHTFAQLSRGGRPIVNNIKNSIPYICMPEVPNDSILNANKESRLKPFQFAYAFRVTINTANSGVWIKNTDGSLVWRLGITSAGAYSLNIIFNQFKPAPGALLFVYDPSRKVILGGFDETSGSINNIFAISPIPGDSIILEYQVPSFSKQKGFLQIEKVGHDFTGTFGKSRLKDSRFNLSGNCNVDINCSDGNDWQTEKRAVVRYLYSGVYYCTGTLINNSMQNGIPYVLTANHCVSSASVANGVVFVFGYESSTCDGADGSVSNSLSGAKLVATNSNLDFTLLKLKNTPPNNYNPYYAGWITTSSAATKTVSIHHPMGDVKKISTDNNAPITSSFMSGYDANAHWKILNWEKGTTEKGSSGSPLFDQNHRIVGTLTGGDALCGSSVNDYYAKFSRQWNDYADTNNQLKYWLDPLKSGTTSITGYDPMATICDTLSNLVQSDTLFSDTLQNPNWGYTLGHNSLNHISFAEHFQSPNNNYVKGIDLNISKAISGNTLSTISIKVWKGKNKPDSLLYEQAIQINTLTPNSIHHITFDSAVIVDTNFYIGYTVSYLFSDTFVLFHRKARISDTSNSTWVNDGIQWHRYKDIWGYGTSIDIKTYICSGIVGIKRQQAITQQTLQIYPNPTDGLITIIPDESWKGISYISVYDMTGSLLIEKTANKKTTTELDLSVLSQGLYILSVRNNDQQKTRKIILRKQ